MDLTGVRGVVTGGASGIGRATAEMLIERGARVVLWDIAEGLEGIASSIGAGAHRVDVTDPVAVRDAVEEVGDVRVLVTSAGVGSIGAVWDVTDDEWDRVTNVNLRGVFLCLREVARAMIANGGGRIVNVASASGAVPDPGMAAYCASKAGVLMLTKVAALDLAPHGVLVNAVAPGPIDTPLMQLALDIPGMRAAFEGIPLRRLGSPHEVARAIVFLLENDWMTGETMFIDGGAQLVGPLGPWEAVKHVIEGGKTRRTSW